METGHSSEEIKVSPLSSNGSLASMLLQIDGASRCKSDIVEEAPTRDSFIQTLNLRQQNMLEVLGFVQKGKWRFRGRS